MNDSLLDSESSSAEEEELCFLEPQTKLRFDPETEELTEVVDF
jgi:hypothetical protein